MNLEKMIDKESFLENVKIDWRDEIYQREVLKQKLQGQNNPKEDIIRDKVKNAVLKEEWAREAFAKIRQKQIDYLKDAVNNIHNEKYIHNLTQKVISEISKKVKSKIVEGEELLDKILTGSPALIVTNHFGAYKLFGVNPKEDIGVDIESYNMMYPYLMYFAALVPVTESLGDNIYYASNDFPGIFGEIHRKAGFIHVSPFAENKMVDLIEQNREAITRRRNSVIVSFPEGTTSGKLSGRGPYDLESFKTGAYVIAAELGIHVIPVAQYFNPEKGYELKVMGPFIPEKSGKENYRKYAEKNRSEMQDWLNKKSLL